MAYTYFSNGFSYFSGSSYYVTYYPEITSVSVTASPTSVAYNGTSTLTVKVYGNNLSNYAKNTRITLSSSALSLSPNKVLSAATKTINPGSVGFSTPLYNVNNLSTNQTVPVNVTVSVSYFGPYNVYQTRSMPKTCSVIANKKTVVSPSAVSYYSYYESYYTYFSNGKLSVTYYTIDSLSVSPSTATVAYNGSVKLTPIVHTNCPGAKVSSIVYSVASPYAVSLSSTKQLNSGRVYSTGAVTLYNTNTKETKATNVVKLTAYLPSGAYRTVNATVIAKGKPVVVNPSVSSYYYISGPAKVSPSVSGASFVANTGTPSVSGSNIGGCSWSFSQSGVYLSNNTWAPLYSYFTLSANGNYAWVGRTGVTLPETIAVPLVVRGAAANGTPFEAHHTCYFEALGKSYFPAVKSFTLSANPSIMAFNGKADIKYDLQLSNDSVKSVAFNGISSSSVCTLSNVKSCTGTTGTIATLVGRPEFCHSGAVVTVSAIAYTQAGLTQSAKVDVKVSPTDMAYYNTYYAPRIDSAFISGAASLANDAEGKYTVSTYIVRDSIKSVSWKSSNDDVLAIASPNLSTVTVKANNVEYVAKSVTLTATVTTWTGLTRSVSKVVKVAGAPVPVETKPTTDEVVAKVNEIFDNAKNAAAVEIAKLA